MRRWTRRARRARRLDRLCGHVLCCHGVLDWHLWIKVVEVYLI